MAPARRQGKHALAWEAGPGAAQGDFVRHRSKRWTPFAPLCIVASMTFQELRAIYDQPFFDLIQQSRIAYLDFWKNGEVQLCTLLSIKTGGCSEDCGYCAQSARYQTGVKAERLMETDAVLEVARRACENGSTRF